MLHGMPAQAERSVLADVLAHFIIRIGLAVITGSQVSLYT